jgi:hypothetical protein
MPVIRTAAFDDAEASPPGTWIQPQDSNNRRRGAQLGGARG